MPAFRVVLSTLPLLLAPAALAAPRQPKPDVALMKQCVAVIESSLAVQSESEIEMNGSGQGITRTFRERILFTRLRPGRFRADVTQTALVTKSRVQYQIISDGRQVWTFNPAGQEYAVTSLADYRKSYNLGRHVAGLGLFGALTVSSEDSQDDALQDLTSLLASQPGASGGTETVDGQVLQKLASGAGSGPQFRFLLNPKTIHFQQLGFTTQGPQVAFSMTETVLRQVFKPKLDPKTFQFTPPKGTRRVAAVSIGLLP